MRSIAAHPALSARFSETTTLVPESKQKVVEYSREKSR